MESRVGKEGRGERGGRTLGALVIFKSLEASEGSSACKKLMAELGFVGPAIGVYLLVSVV